MRHKIIDSIDELFGSIDMFSYIEKYPNVVIQLVEQEIRENILSEIMEP